MNCKLLKIPRQQSDTLYFRSLNKTKYVYANTISDLRFLETSFVKNFVPRKEDPL